MQQSTLQSVCNLQYCDLMLCRSPADYCVVVGEHTPEKHNKHRQIIPAQSIDLHDDYNVCVLSVLHHHYKLSAI